MRFQLPWFNPAEGKKQHQKDQKGLENLYNTGKQRTDTMDRFRHVMVYEINGCSRQHGDGKHPFLDYILQAHTRPSSLFNLVFALL